ncbi:MAG: restriction endonuclease subunit S [Algicola sp.]|nr:restriction endonuclease subunit S [Algicola sp.]
MTDIQSLVTDNIDVWTTAIKQRTGVGRGSSKKIELTGIKKLRELILELAVRGKLVPQDPTDEPASVLLEKIAAEKALLVKDEKLKTKASEHISKDDLYLKTPDVWGSCRLGNLARFIDYRGKTPTKLSSGIRLITAKNVKFGYISKQPEEFISAEEYTSWMTRGFPKIGDVLFTPEAPLGNVAVIDLEEKFALAQRAICFQFHESQISKFIMFVIMSPVFQDQLLKNATGTTAKGIKASKLKEIIVPIPPLKEQFQIVRRVDELMILCDQLEQKTEGHITAHQTLVEVLLGTLTSCKNNDEFQQNWARIAEHFDALFTTTQSIELLKQTILQLAVIGKLVPQDPNDEPAAVLLKKIADEKVQLIKDKKIKKQKALPAITEDEKPFYLPQNWEWVRLGSIYRFLNGYAFKSEWFESEGVKVLRNINIAHGTTKWNDTAFVSKEKVDEFARFELEEGDIVISLDRPIINTGLKYAIIQSADLPCLLLQRVAKFHSYGDVIVPIFLSRWLESDLFMSAIDPGRSNGVPHISTKQLEMMLFPLLSQNEQHRIVAKVDELLTICDQLKSQISSAQITQLNLADAIVGQAVS